MPIHAMPCHARAPAPALSLSLSLSPLAHSSTMPPPPSTMPTTGLLLHWASPLVCRREPPTAPTTLSLYPLSLHSPTTGPSWRPPILPAGQTNKTTATYPTSPARLPPPTRPDQPTQQMPQLTDQMHLQRRPQARATVQPSNSLPAFVRRCTLRRMPPQLRGAARLLSALSKMCHMCHSMLQMPKCHKCQSAAKCDVPLCPSLPLSSRLPISLLTHRRHVKWGPNQESGPAANAEMLIMKCSNAGCNRRRRRHGPLGPGPNQAIYKARPVRFSSLVPLLAYTHHHTVTPYQPPLPIISLSISPSTSATSP
jgi:hypothetical protein